MSWNVINMMDSTKCKYKLPKVKCSHKNNFGEPCIQRLCPLRANEDKLNLLRSLLN